MQYSYIYDIIVLVIAFACVILAWKKGFASSLVSFGGRIIALAGAYIASIPVANAIYDKLIHNMMVQKIASIIEGAADADTVAGMLASGFDGLNMPFSSFFSENLTKLGDTIAANFASGTDVMADQIVRTVCQPVLVGVFQIILVLILYIILSFVVSVIAKALGIINKVPLIGGLNKILGGVFGLLNAGIWCYILAGVVGLFIGLTNGNIDFMNNQIIDKTVLFKLIYQLSPFK